VLAFTQLSSEFDAKYKAFKRLFQCYFGSSNNVLHGVVARR